MGRVRGFADQTTLLKTPARAVPAGTKGHHARLRARLLAAGPESLADHELLEMVLFIALPRRDTKALARTLIARFGSLADAISAPPQELLVVGGIGESGVAMLKTVPAAALLLARGEIDDKPVLSTWDQLMKYLNAVLARERVKQFRILFLDGRNRLLADEAQSCGTVNHTSVYPCEVAKRGLELHASGVILVQNHPSGDLTPSYADFEMTQEIKRAMRPLSIVLHDHVVVGNGSWLSFREEALL